MTSWVTIVLVSLAYSIFDRNPTQILLGITSVRTGFSRDPAYAKSVFSRDRTHTGDSFTVVTGEQSSTDWDAPG